jgi:hypothetical protein
MDLRDLVTALLRYDALTARQWIADAARAGFVWTEIPAPQADMDDTECAVAAGVAELLAMRAGQLPPAWAAGITPVTKRLFLVRSAATMPRLRAACELEGPEPLRRRGIFAPPDFLTTA